MTLKIIYLGENVSFYTKNKYFRKKVVFPGNSIVFIFWGEKVFLAEKILEEI